MGNSREGDHYFLVFGAVSTNLKETLWGGGGIHGWCDLGFFFVAILWKFGNNPYMGNSREGNCYSYFSFGLTSTVLCHSVSLRLNCLAGLQKNPYCIGTLQ